MEMLAGFWNWDEEDGVLYVILDILTVTIDLYRVYIVSKFYRLAFKIVNRK